MDPCHTLAGARIAPPPRAPACAADAFYEAHSLEALHRFRHATRRVRAALGHLCTRPFAFPKRALRLRHQEDPLP